MVARKQGSIGLFFVALYSAASHGVTTYDRGEINMDVSGVGAVPTITASAVPATSAAVDSDGLDNSTGGDASDGGNQLPDAPGFKAVLEAAKLKLAAEGDLISAFNDLVSDYNLLIKDFSVPSANPLMALGRYAATASLGVTVTLAVVGTNIDTTQ
ncbi:MAG: hypothetical protein WAV46_00700 [Candidatus Moraniibacteriota bacterium]